MEAIARIGVTLQQLAGNLGDLVFEIAQLGVSCALLIVWIAWWLGAVNWTKMWPTLQKGAWMPLLLVCVLASLVWSRLAPGASGGWPVFWWHLTAVIVLFLSALICGWLQGVFHWTPMEVNVNPPAHGHGHGHDHGHH